MKVIIIAAGRATRLLPLTKENPQCLLKIGNKTILEKQIENLKKSNLSDITIITGYFSEKVEEFCKSLGVKTLFNPFYNVSGMASTLWITKNDLKNGFIFLYSDVLFDAKIIGELLQNKGDITLAIKKNKLREEAEKVVEENNFIKDVTKIKKEIGNGEFIGIAKFSSNGSKQLVKELNLLAKINIAASFINVIDNLIKKGNEIHAYDIKDSKYIDIDFLEDLEMARKNFP
jgi:choline kinase